MPPEQVLGKPLTSQADVYSFGILLYELLSGIRPVSDGSVDQIFQAILTEPLNMDPLKALNLPPALISMIDRCTAKQADRRPAGLGEVRNLLQGILQALPPGTSHGVRLPAPQATPQPQPRSQAVPPSQKPPAASLPPTPVMAASTMPKVEQDTLPSFLQVLPTILRTQTGLMLVSCSAVLVVMALLLGILKLTNAI
jgi:serine/threonine protein kinase